MDQPIAINTYSKKNPRVLFQSSCTLIPKKPDGEMLGKLQNETAVANVSDDSLNDIEIPPITIQCSDDILASLERREAEIYKELKEKYDKEILARELRDKYFEETDFGEVTLDVDPYVDEFEKVATGVVIPSPKKKRCTDSDRTVFDPTECTTSTPKFSRQTMNTKSSSIDEDFDGDDIDGAVTGMVTPPEKDAKRKINESPTSMANDKIGENNSNLSEFVPSPILSGKRIKERAKRIALKKSRAAAEAKDKQRIASEQQPSHIVGEQLPDSPSKHYEEANKFMDDGHSRRLLLKPGKSFGRCLSIIKFLQSDPNLEVLSARKGKEWRLSVDAILKMQPKGVIPSFRSLPVHVALQRKSSGVTAASAITSSSRFSQHIVPSDEGSTTLTLNDLADVDDKTRESSLTRKFTSLTIDSDTLIKTEDDVIRSARDIILKRCKQTCYIPFNDYFPDSYKLYCRKIGEGVYGEVFLHEDGTDKTVVKIIPIEGDKLVNQERQKKFHEILSEVITSQELHKLRFGDEHNTNGFVQVKKIACIEGRYPRWLLKLWTAFDKEIQSENDCPSMFGRDQLFIILELVYGGQTIESYEFKNTSESLSMFLQIALTLAVAEQSLEFEHRDLHMGNILIAETDEPLSTYKLGNREISIPTKGIKTTIIDFTLSRMSYKGCKFFTDLAADPTLFLGEGDYQFEIYRLMQDSLKNDWQQFNGYTNLLWLHYILYVMVNYTYSVDYHGILQLEKLSEVILSYKSAFDFNKAPVDAGVTFVLAAEPNESPGVLEADLRHAVRNVRIG